jgi:hypothetical protein
MAVVWSLPIVPDSRGLDRSEEFAVIKCQPAIGDPTKAVRLLQYRIEYRGEVAGRGIDDLQYLGGCDLLLKRLVTLGFAVGKFSLTLGKVTFEISYAPFGIG